MGESGYVRIEEKVRAGMKCRAKRGIREERVIGSKGVKEYKGEDDTERGEEHVR